MTFFASPFIMIHLAPMEIHVWIPSKTTSLSICNGKHMLFIVMVSPFVSQMIILILAFCFFVEIVSSKFIFMKSPFEGIHLRLSFFSFSWILAKSSRSFINLHALDNSECIFQILPLKMISFLFFNIYKCIHITIFGFCYLSLLM